MSRTVSRSLLALPLIAMLGLAACSGDAEDTASPSPTSDRPSAEQISGVLTDGSALVEGFTMDQEMADCWGSVLNESEMSDEALKALVNGDEDYAPDEAQTQALMDAVTAGSEECGAPA